MTVTLVLRSGAVALLIQAALLLWALREQSDGRDWATLRRSILPVAAVGSVLSTGACAAIVYLLSTGWKVLGEGDAWTENRAAWLVLGIAVVSQAIGRAVEVPVHPTIPEAYVTAIP